MALTFAIAGGGTGGHVTLALALGEAIRARGDRVVFLGTARGMEARLVPEAGFELVTLSGGQVVGRGLLGAARGALSILIGVAPARRALREARADVVISVGGYAAMAPVLAASVTRTPLALLEPNAIPGRVNRIAARLAQRVFVGFEQTGALLGLRPGSPRLRCLGIPLRSDLVESCAAAQRDHGAHAPASPFRLLIFGGSQGARQINDAIIAALPTLRGMGLQVFHQTGPDDRDRVARAYAESGVDSQVVAFEADMPSRYRWAQLAVCRAGALTVAELALARLPALLVPYPHSADNHQAANAAALESLGAARCLDARALDTQTWLETLRELMAAPELLAKMREAAGELARPDAAKRIAEECAALARAQGPA